MPTNNWIQSKTGGKIVVLDPDWRQIKLEDVASGLSNQTRFNGQLSAPYSIAQHCVMGAELLPKDLQLVFLTHELGECLLPECTTPLKGALLVQVPWADHPVTWRALEDRHTIAILRALGLSIPLSEYYRPEVKAMDGYMLAWEARDLHCPPPEPWGLVHDPLPEKVISPWGFGRAKHEWLSLYRELVGESPSQKLIQLTAAMEVKRALPVIG